VRAADDTEEQSRDPPPLSHCNREASVMPRADRPGDGLVRATLAAG